MPAFSINVAETIDDKSEWARVGMARQFSVGPAKRSSYWDLDKEPYGYKRFRQFFLFPTNVVKRKLHVLPWMMAAVSAIIILFCLWNLVGARVQVDTPFVFVEVKAVDSFGRPVSGAEVKFNGKAMGLTDTFGEWRRLLRLTLGSSIPVEIVKRISHEEIRASKIIKLPLRIVDQRNLELRVNVKLNTAPAGFETSQTQAGSGRMPASPPKLAGATAARNEHKGSSRAAKPLVR